MQTNNLYFCKATETALHILTGRESVVADLYAESAAITTARLRPVELRWLAYAADNFDTLHRVALAAGPHKKHLLTILPDEEAAL